MSLKTPVRKIGDKSESPITYIKLLNIKTQITYTIFKISGIFRIKSENGI